MTRPFFGFVANADTCTFQKRRGRFVRSVKQVRATSNFICLLKACANNVKPLLFDKENIMKNNQNNQNNQKNKNNNANKNCGNKNCGNSRDCSYKNND